MRTAFRDTAGFTLNEMLVSLVVGGLVVSFGISLFVFSSRMFHSWQKKRERQQTTERIVQRIAYDVLKSKNILALTDTSLHLELGAGSTVHYMLDSGTVVRNNDALPAAGVVTTITREAGRVHITAESNSGESTHRATTKVSAKQNARTRFRESNRN